MSTMNIIGQVLTFWILSGVLAFLGARIFFKEISHDQDSFLYHLVGGPIFLLAQLSTCLELSRPDKEALIEEAMKEVLAKLPSDRAEWTEDDHDYVKRCRKSLEDINF